VTFGSWRAEPTWRRIDLLSDVHLHADAPRTFDAFRAHLLGTPADAVLILGDLFEAWVGDDDRFQGFHRDCAEVLREASRGKRLGFMHGNRDFLVGPQLLADCGLAHLDDPTVGQAFGERVLLTHGDALCIGDLAYQRFRTEVRGAAWRDAFLAQPLAARQRTARAMRDASTAHQAALGADAWADVDADLAARWLDEAGCAVMIHGHTHRPGRYPLPGGRVRHVLGDWHFDGTARPRASALRWTAGGLDELDLAAP
jgi:UDP-2,3-diacylglucosamine hydrolase